MTEREKIPAADSLPPMPAATNAESAGTPSKTGIYEDPTGGKSERLVGMYDRPERAGPSPLLLIVAALVVIALLFLLFQFVF
jgi:hypothetical protein